MTETAVQASFNSGEWSPNLYARVDLQKYRSAAALLENFFVDYRGGASTRPGTKYVIQAYKSATQVRVIRFQESFNIGYAVEIGNGYMRFIYQGSPVLEPTFAITGATQANPCVLTIVGNNFTPNDWIYVTGVTGMTQLNGRFFQVLSVTGSAVTIGYLSGANLDSTTYGAYSAGGTAARIYTIASPYTNADDLRLIKFAQSTTQMFLCHPNHPVYVLTLISAANWTLIPATFGSTISAPAAPTVTTTLGAGSANYAYEITAIDALGQESQASPAGTLASKLDLRTNPGTNTLTWSAVGGAVAYNIYEAALNYSAVVPAGVQYGFIGTCQGTSFIDNNIAQDFTLTPPIARNPFVGGSVTTVAVTAPGTYTTVPGVTFSGACTRPATGTAQLAVQGTPTVAAGGTGYTVGQVLYAANGLTVQVATLAGSAVATVTVVNAGAVTSGSTPSNPLATSSFGRGSGCTLNATWGVSQVNVVDHGLGYSVAPTVIFSSGAATATATISASAINPQAVGFVQQRLVLAAPASNPATFYMSKTGQYYNFDVSLPIRSSDSVSGTLVSGSLNTIKWIVGAATGMLLGTDQAVWLVNGGSPQAAITASAAVANPQSYIGASDVPPVIANYDVLFVQAKGNAIRSIAYDFYRNIFTGEDISILSSHLFYNHTIPEWCWAEQPFYTAQAIRDDGYILALTYLKEQQFIGWSHYVTNGLYKSIASVSEVLSNGVASDAVYTVVQRTVGGVPLQYIERTAERTFPNGYLSAWCVDAGLQYSGSPATTFTGAEHLAGLTVTGLADGVPITPFVMPTTGIFTLGSPASTVTVGLAYTCKLQTLPLDIGDPTIQGKTKKIPAATVRVAQTLGLKMGSDFTTLVDLKDLVLGNVSSALTGQPTQVVSDLVDGNALVYLDPTYTIPGQYCIQQSQPYPATVLGVFPEFAVGERR